jgi:cytochrome b pre-mRNA-processing protein 3
MLRFLFPTLTADAARGADLFAWITGQARAAHWYLAGAVEDSVDGRFAMLATITALASIRLDSAGDAGLRANVALTERFIEVMESEHREMGLGDPKLGRTVRKLVGSLARRVELWRSAVSDGDWIEGARKSVYGQDEPSIGALDHTANALRKLWSRLQSSPDSAVAQGLLE